MATGRRLPPLLAGLIFACIGLAAYPVDASGRSSQLTRYPYLTDVTRHKATINWATTRAHSSGRVKWSRTGRGCRSHKREASRTSIEVGSRDEYQWKAKLSGLDANTRYCYRIYFGSDSATDLLGSDGARRFVTALRSGSRKRFKFAVIGDWGYTTSSQTNTHQAAVLKQLAKSGARFAVSTGDIAYDSGTQTNYGDLFQRGAQVSTVFGPSYWTVPGDTIPMFPVLGNHGRNSTFLNIWPQAGVAHRSDGRFGMKTYCCHNDTRSASYPRAWYAFNYGGARLYVLNASWSNSNVGNADIYENDYDYHWRRDSSQYEWLKDDLEDHGNEVKLAFFHFPLYSANADEGSDEWLQGGDSLEGLLSRHGVDIAFNGHSHIYERNRRSRPNRLRSYVTGGGGARLAPVSRCSAGSGDRGLVAYAIGWSNSSSHGSACGSASAPSSIAHVYHFLLVRVHGHHVTVKPIDSTGKRFDVRRYKFGGG